MNHFGFIWKDGKPVRVLHGTSAVFYEDGKRVERPVIIVEAENGEEALKLIIENGSAEWNFPQGTKGAEKWAY